MPTENMTSEEAIKRLETIIEEIYTWREELGEKLSERDRADINAYKVSIEALRKQTPKKVKPMTYKLLRDHGWNWECPTCKLAVGINLQAKEYTQEDTYCSSCGQRLSWED